MKLTSIIPLTLTGTALCGSVLAQNQFPANGQSVTLGYTASAEDYIVPTTDVPRLIKIALRGASGGDATATRWPITRLGGHGARIESIFSVGTGPNDVQPGGLIRFIVGQRGRNGSGRLDANGGGGGGTGVLYRAPGSPTFVPLMIAGAGGGATASQSGSDPGFPGSFGGCGSSCTFAGGNGTGGAGGGGLNGNGQAATANGPYGGRMGNPAGGTGGTSTSAAGNGGWGCGGGGGGGSGGGGGGGAVGGRGGGRQIEGGGGGSYINLQYTLSPRSDRYDSDRGDGYAIFTPLLGSGESIEDTIDIPDPITGVGEYLMQGDTNDNIRTAPGSWTPSCTPGADPSPDAWYRFTNTAGCERELRLLNGSDYPVRLILGATPGSFAGASCIVLPRGGAYPLYPTGNSSLYIGVSSDPSQFPFRTVMNYRMLVAIDIRGTAQPPSIVSQPPIETLVDLGPQANPIMMSVVAQNAARYQWLKMNLQGQYEELPGQTSADLTLPYVQCADTGMYKCRVTGSCFSSIESSEAILFVGPVGGARQVGFGCAADARFLSTTFYEFFLQNGSPIGLDLGTRSLRFTPATSGGWRMSDDASGFDTRYQNGLGLGDDQLSRNHALGFSFPLPDGSGSTDAIDIDSNGWIGLVSGAHSGSQYLASSSTMLQGPARIAACWQDLNPAAGGDVYFDVLADRALITWVDVPDFRSGRLSTFQVQLFPNGEFVLSYPGFPGARVPMVGYSAGGVSNDPGMIDISETQNGPNLRGSVFAPTIGESFELRVTAEGPTAGGLIQVGFLPLSLDLTLFGLPGCVLRTSGDATFPLPSFSAGVSMLTLNVPADPSLLSFEVHAQAIVNEPGANSLGLVFSNGLRITLGGCRY